jgi:oligosaccharide repeat unit polymerase
MSNVQKGKRVPHPFLTASLTNPFAAYATSFALAVSVYSLGYSDLYPPLQSSLKWFLLSTSLICVFLAYASGKIALRYPCQQERFGTHLAIFFALLAVFSVEVIVNGGIPLVLLVTLQDFNYKDFGIPTLHVAFTGFSFFYAVYWFDLYTIGQGKRYLALSIPTFGTSLLIVSRGAFIVLLIAMLVVHIRRRGFTRRLLLSFAGILAIVVWGFGFVGNLRSNESSSESLIFAIGKPSDNFLNSNIPAELFWTYLYTSSPLANLQLNITDRTAADSPGLYFILEFLPDFVSKRLTSEGDIAASVPLLNTDQLNVSTMYGRAFFLMGWLGALLSFCYFVIVSILCMRALQRSKYFVATLGILTAIAFLEIFDNMFTFAGGIMPVLVALFLNLFEHTHRNDLAPIDSSRGAQH